MFAKQFPRVVALRRYCDICQRWTRHRYDGRQDFPGRKGRAPRAFLLFTCRRCGGTHSKRIKP